MKNIALKFSAVLIALTLAVLAPADAAAKVGLSVTPKIWFTVENFNAFETALLTNNTTRTISLREQVNIPLAGAAVGFRPGDAPIDFLFNFYGGTGKGNFLGVIGPATTPQFNGRYELKRTDIEFLVRYLPKERPWNLFTGIRVNSFKDTQTLTSAHIWSSTGKKTQVTDTTIVLWEVGAGFQAPINEAGTHRFFGNATFGVGSFATEISNASTTLKKNRKDGGAAAWDINSGYEVFLGEYFSLAARYRMYAKPTSPMDDGYNLTVIHGPDFGATLRF